MKQGNSSMLKLYFFLSSVFSQLVLVHGDPVAILLTRGGTLVILGVMLSGARTLLSHRKLVPRVAPQVAPGFSENPSIKCSELHYLAQVGL